MRDSICFNMFWLFSPFKRVINVTLPFPVPEPVSLAEGNWLCTVLWAAGLSYCRLYMAEES